VIASIAILWGYGMETGGPAEMLWSWPVVAFASLLVSLSLAEICSVYPTAGGVYYWAFQLAPEGWEAFFSWMTVWFNIMGQWTAVAGVAFALGGYWTAFFNLTSDVEYTVNHVIGFDALMIVLFGVLNLYSVRTVDILNTISTVWHMAGVFIISIWLLVGSHVQGKLRSGEWISKTFVNYTGFSDSYCILIGGLLAQLTFCGYEGSACMSEETHRARISAPVGIFSAVLASFPFGWFMLFAMVASIQDYDAVLNSPTGMPFVQVFIDATGVKPALFLLIIVIGATFFAAIAFVASLSRVIYALARDGGFPWSNFFLKLSSRGIPYRIVILVVLFAWILTLPNLRSPVAFNALLSINTIGLYISYGIPIALRVYKGSNFKPSLFTLGKFSVPIGVFSVFWVALITIVFVLPIQSPVGAKSMNYAVLLVGAVFFGALLAWILGVRKTFKGPNRKMQSTRSQINLTPFEAIFMHGKQLSKRLSIQSIDVK